MADKQDTTTPKVGGNQADTLHALVIRDATYGLKYIPKYGMVAQTEYMESGQWVSGMVLITSIEDVLERAEKLGVPIIFESMLESSQQDTPKTVSQEKRGKDA